MDLNIIKTWIEAKFRLGQEEDGASMVEYALLAALIAVVVIGAVFLIGNNAKDTLSKVGESIAQ